MGVEEPRGWGRGRLDETAPDTGELFFDLASIGGARIESIVSSSAPDPRLQVQGWDEWVLLVVGAAELEVDGTTVTLASGEWLLIPEGTPHRVLGTRAGTQWVAVHGLVEGPQPAVLPPPTAQA